MRTLVKVKRRKIMKRLKIKVTLLAAAMVMSLAAGIHAYAEDAYAGDMRWDFTSDMEGWVADGADTGAGGNGAMNMEINGIENGIAKLIRWQNQAGTGHAAIKLTGTKDLSQYKYLRVTGMDTTPGAESILYINDGAWRRHQVTREKDENGVPISDTQMKEYVFELNLTTPTNVNTIRFDPLSLKNNLGTSIYYIDSIVLSKNAEPMTTSDITAVKIDDVAISRFDSTKEVQTIIISREDFRKFAAKTAVVTAELSDSANSSVITYNTGVNYSTGAYHAYIDIDVKGVDGNIIREYRIILLPDMTKDPAREDIIISNGTRGMGTGGSTTTTITSDAQAGTQNYAFSATDTGKDPNVWNYINGMNNWREYSYIKVRMKDNSTSSGIQFYLAPNTNVGANHRTIGIWKTNRVADTDYVDYVIPTDFITSGVGADFNSVGWARFDYMNDVSEGSVDIDYWMFTNYPESEVMICDIAQVWSQQDGLYDMNVYLENDTANDIICDVYAGVYGTDGRLKAVMVKQAQQLAKDVRVTVGFGDYLLLSQGNQQGKYRHATQISFGYAKKVFDDNIVSMSRYLGGDETERMVFPSAVAVCDSETGEIYSGSIADVLSYEAVGDSCSKLFYHTYVGVGKGMFIYR